MVSRRQIERWRHKMPGRVRVRVIAIGAKDTFDEPFSLLAEQRPVSIAEQHGSEASANQISSEFILWQIELGSYQLKKADVIEVVDQQQWWAVDTVSIELMGTRLRARCYETINPLLEF
jgi:hypothetical protein